MLALTRALPWNILPLASHAVQQLNTGLTAGAASGTLLLSMCASSSAVDYSTQATEPGAGGQWRWMQEQGHKVNPCNSPLHPAVEEGIEPDGEEVPVQAAYTPNSHCFGCGPAHPDGLGLRSFRITNGLEARLSLPPKYSAFPGIINGGVLSTLMDCHGNWTAAVALMDRSLLPKPPLTLTASMLVSYKEPTPPDTEIIVRSSVVALKDNTPGLGKASVEVDITVLLASNEKLLATGTGIFKRLGALRAL